MSNLREQKYNALIYSMAPDLQRYAYWKCGDRDLAEELVQETFLRAWRSLDSLRDSDSAKAWLFTIFRRELARQYERKRLEFSDVGDLNDMPAINPGQDTSTEAFVLNQGLIQLSEEYREPLLLQVLGGFSCDEIADTLGITSGAAMTRLFRARKKMRQLLTEIDTTSRENGVRAA